MADQLIIPDAFPDRDDELEVLVAQYLKAKLAESKSKAACEAKYDSIKAKLLFKEIDVYHCYDRRYRVEMKPDEPAVKVKPVKETQPSPYRPGNEQASAGDPPAAARGDSRDS